MAMPYHDGESFERHVAQLYSDILCKKVYHDVFHKSDGHISQIDIEYDTIFGRRYVECKYRSNGRMVSLEEIAKFAAVLEIIGERTSKGEFVTNTDYTGRAKSYAARKGIRLYDLHDVKRMEEKTSPHFILSQLVQITKFYK